MYQLCTVGVNAKYLIPKKCYGKNFGVNTINSIERFTQVYTHNKWDKYSISGDFTYYLNLLQHFKVNMCYNSHGGCIPVVQFGHKYTKPVK